MEENLGCQHGTKEKWKLIVTLPTYQRVDVLMDGVVSGSDFKQKQPRIIDFAMFFKYLLLAKFP